MDLRELLVINFQPGEPETTPDRWHILECASKSKIGYYGGEAAGQKDLVEGRIRMYTLIEDAEIRLWGQIARGF